MLGGMGAGGEGDKRGWDGWMASLTRWTWVWMNSGSWWWTGRPGVMRFMGSQRVRHDWATDLIWSDAWNIPLITLIFLKRSLVFPILLFSSISLQCSLRKSFLSLLAILWNSAFRWVYLSFSPFPFILLFSQLFVRLPQTIILPFCISFSWIYFWLLSLVQCYEPLSIVLQALWISNV